ncbi:MAG: GtrA family protein [Actinomycetota bacterium]|nr:GtrA family protein [Actinomycetota bacterium]
MFAVVGAVTTLAYSLVYVALRPSMGAPAANVLAFLVTAAANTAGHRRYTFRVRDDGHLRQQVLALPVLLSGVALTSGSLWLLEVVVAVPHPALEAGVLAVANVVAAVIHFLALRDWVFRPQDGSGAQS